MNECKKKEIEQEKLWYEQTITNLNFEVNEKLKSGELELEQVNALYAVEDALHEKRMKDIKECNLYAEQMIKILNYNLSSSLNALMQGKNSAEICLQRLKAQSYRALVMR